MPTKLIELDDGTLIEVETKPGQLQQIDSSVAKRVDTAMDAIKPVIKRVSHSINEAWKEINEIDEKILIEQTDLEFGIGFEGEGNLYITRAKTTANLVIKITLKPR